MFSLSFVIAKYKERTNSLSLCFDIHSTHTHKIGYVDDDNRVSIRKRTISPCITKNLFVLIRNLINKFFWLFTPLTLRAGDFSISFLCIPLLYILAVIELSCCNPSTWETKQKKEIINNNSTFLFPLVKNIKGKMSFLLVFTTVCLHLLFNNQVKQTDDCAAFCWREYRHAFNAVRSLKYTSQEMLWPTCQVLQFDVNYSPPRKKKWGYNNCQRIPQVDGLIVSADHLAGIVGFQSIEDELPCFFFCFFLQLSRDISAPPV